MNSLDEWRQYLMGAWHPLEVWMDYKNLEYFCKPQKLNRRQVRWVTELAEYYYMLHHKPSRAHGKVDRLSCRKGHQNRKDDNRNIILLKPDHFRALIRSIIFDLEEPSEDWIKEIKNHKNNQDTVVIMALQNKEKDWNEDENRLVTWKNRIYVPIHRRLREQIIAQHHDLYMAGHPGIYKTHKLITRNYWWPCIHANIQKYVDGCEKCQKTKVHTTWPTGLLFLNKIPTRPWKIISVDKIGILPESFGFNAILVIVCLYSKQIIVVPSHIELNVEGWSKALRDHVIAQHKLLWKIISDRGAEFQNQFISKLYHFLRIKANLSTSYHPQTDRQTEWINRKVEQCLWLFINYRQSD